MGKDALAEIERLKAERARISKKIEELESKEIIHGSVKYAIKRGHRLFIYVPNENIARVPAMWKAFVKADSLEEALKIATKIESDLHEIIEALKKDSET